ncbi:MAG TPA: hypothetical protein DEO49_05545, partial [Sutterella sp.]|nr:hypothetical protein [Sutterella sp.]
MADKTNRKIKLSDFIRTQLAKRGWTGLDFCTLLGGIPKSAGSKIANGKQAPSFRQLAILAAIFETDINDIMAMRLYEESCEDCEAYRLSGVHKRIIEIFKKVPVNELLSNHWVSVLDRNDLSEMLRAFEPYLAEAEEASGLAHKTHADDIQFTNLQKAWLLRVRNLARKRTPAGVFSKDALPQTIDLLKEAMRRNSSIADAVKILDEAGIRLVLVECKGSCIDAVCTWLDHSPVIGMTLRFDRVDNFWFVLRHELAHVEQGPSVTPIV